MATDWKDALSALTGIERTETPNSTQQPTNTANTNKKKRQGVVYSTNPDYHYSEGDETEIETLPKQQQKLRLAMERAGRSGKTVTIVRGFIGTQQDLTALCKLLKQKCGVGGTTKDQEIVIQGDLRAKLLDILKAEGYKQTK